MAITASVTINLEMDRPNDLVLIHAVQGEYYSRQVTANLKQNGSAYTIPSEAIALIRYRKPDGKIGFYDFDPAGNRIVTIINSNHSVRFTIAPEMCDVPGRVFGHIDLYSKTSGNRLSAFYFYVDVEKAATDPEIIREVNVTGVHDLLEEIIGSVYTPSATPQEGAIIDNTLSIPGAVGDAKAMGDVVLIQDEEPDSEEQPTNKIWINSDSLEEGIEVPDIDDIVSEFSTTKTYSAGDYVNYLGHIYKYIAETASSGAWDNSKWELVVVCDEIANNSNEISDLKSKLDAAQERTYNLLTNNWIKKFNAKFTILSNGIMVANTAVGYGYVYQIIDVRQYNYVSLALSEIAGTAAGLVMLGKATSADATEWQWTEQYSVATKTYIVVTNYDYMVVALYVGLYTDSSLAANSYVHYNGLVLNPNIFNLPYTPSETCVDHTLRETYIDDRVYFNRVMAEKSSNLLLNDSNQWKTIKGAVTIEEDKSSITVRAAQSAQYLYALKDISVIGINTITISGSLTGTGQGQIRIGKATQIDADTVSWKYNTANLPVTYDVSDCDYIRVALYCGYNTAASIGDYVTYFNLQIESGDTVHQYVPGMSAVDSIARMQIKNGAKYYHIPLEQGNIPANTGEDEAYSSAQPRVRSGFLYLYEGDTIINLLPGSYFAWRYYAESQQYISYSSWLQKPFTVQNEGYYRIIIKYTAAGLSDDGMDDPVKNYTPFYIVKNVKGENLYKWLDAESGNTKISIHRGMGLLAPENTLPAFRMSLQYGFTWIETDVWWTSDGYPVICHDPTVDRTSNGTGTIADMTLSQLKALDFGSWFGVEWTGTKIPTLEEALFDAKKYGYKLQLEPKESWTTNNRAETVVGLIEKYGMERNVSVAGFDGYTLIKVHQLNDHIDIGQTFTEITETYVSYVESLKGSHNNVFIMVYPISGITAENAAYAHTAHIPIMASVSNTVGEIEALMEYGVERVLTDGINILDAYRGHNIIPGIF